VSNAWHLGAVGACHSHSVGGHEPWATQYIAKKHPGTRWLVIGVVNNVNKRKYNAIGHTHSKFVRYEQLHFWVWIKLWWCEQNLDDVNKFFDSVNKIWTVWTKCRRCDKKNWWCEQNFDCVIKCWWCDQDIFGVNKRPFFGNCVITPCGMIISHVFFWCLQWCLGLSTVERMLLWWSLGRGESNLRTHGPKFRTFPSKITRGLHQTPPSNPRVGTQSSPKAVTHPEGLVNTQHPAVQNDHPGVSAQSQLSTCEDARP